MRPAPRVRPVYLAASLAYMGLIFYLSHQPSIGGPLSYWIRLLHSLPGGDKASHFLEYAGLGFLLGKAFNRPLLAVLLSAAYGITDEFHQSFVPGRDAGAPDWFADVLGCCVGAAASRIRLPWETAADSQDRPSLRGETESSSARNSRQTTSER